MDPYTISGVFEVWNHGIQLIRLLLIGWYLGGRGSSMDGSDDQGLNPGGLVGKRSSSIGSVGWMVSF